MLIKYEKCDKKSICFDLAASVYISATPFLFQLLGGINYPTSESPYLFAEATYMIGSFEAKPNIEGAIAKDVELNGFIIRGGIRFKLR